MRTYIYTSTDSPVRGCNVRITVMRIKRNRPHVLGSSDHNTASWKGDYWQALDIIHNVDGVKYATDRDGNRNTYALRGEVGPAGKYTDSGHFRDAVRVFGV